ncbi:MAG: hypothetical protein BV459_09150 [Thermoplasmata archaeon M11B2D]|nr:MAG: hypothetical protein BV459_09150 [Thermoplasmata archaeon M11B2D]
MVRRYIGDATIYITYSDKDDETYHGSVVTNDGYRWAFEMLRAPQSGFPHAYDSSMAYDKMAKAALSFASYYTSFNRHGNTPDWAPDVDTADAIAAATDWAVKDVDGYTLYDVRRKK